MEREKLSRTEIVSEYRDEVECLSKYLPWLETKTGKEVSGYYADQGLERNSMTVPVYDGTLLRFVKEAARMKLMDPNYAYVYSRYRIRSYQDEWALISQAKLTDIALLKGILSHYVLKGMTKGVVWTEAVEHQIFVRVIGKMKELMDFWDGAQESE